MTNYEREIILKIKQGDLKASYDLININRNLLYSLYRKMPIQGYSFSEFCSLSYVALIKAAKAAELEKIDYFIGFWKQYIVGEYHRERLRINYCFTISAPDFHKAKVAEIDINNSFTNRYGNIFDDNDDIFESVYSRELRLLIWTEIGQTLDRKNAYILHEIYSNKRSLSSLAKELHIGAERVRRRKLRSLNKLKSNKILQALAQDYFGIAIE